MWLFVYFFVLIVYLSVLSSWFFFMPPCNFNGGESGFSNSGAIGSDLSMFMYTGKY